MTENDINDEIKTEITSKDGDAYIAVKDNDTTTTDEDLGIFIITAYNVSHETDYSTDNKIPAKGLEKEYGEKFLKDIIIQGTGVDKEGKYITIDWLKGKPSTPAETKFIYIDGVRGAAGRNLESGISIAVDPAVIPLGIWVKIDGIGSRRADDTEGAIKGKHIDVFMDVSRKDAIKFGRQEKNVYKLKA